MKTPHPIKRWKSEQEAALLYRTISDLESGNLRQLLFLELALEADEQAISWAKEAKKQNYPIPPFLPGKHSLFLIHLISIFGINSYTLLALNTFQLRGLSFLIPEKGPSPLSKLHPFMRISLQSAHDGGLSTMCALSASVGANLETGSSLLLCVVVMLVGGFTMAAGELLASNTPKTIRTFDQHLRHELNRIYQAKGLQAEESAAKIQEILASGDFIIEETLVAKQTPVNHESNRYTRSAATFFSFCTGAAIPILPQVMQAHRNPILYSSLLGMMLISGTAIIMAWSRQKSLLLSPIKTLAFAMTLVILSHLIGQLFH